MLSAALPRILDRLSDRIGMAGTVHRLPDEASYFVPGLWVDPYGPVGSQAVSPDRFFHDRLQAILQMPPQEPVASRHRSGEWGRHAVAYNLFVRLGAAWDHDGDGKIAVQPDAAGWRETGTFLKAITLLPFIRSLGCNTVHLLPITSIGKDGNKGDLGSPFAIRDPYALDENQSEPALGLGAEAEFAAFVEAAHHLGLRVIVEFVFRTAAKDAAWAGEHPEWFYWIREDMPDREPGQASEAAYGAPLFTADELEKIYRQVATGEYVDLLPPHASYRHMFLPPPAREDVWMAGGRWRGRVRDPETGEVVTVRIPGAFSDWTPDSDQPPWTDVTYLRLYDHLDFNYIAYNTVRIYDTRLAQPQNAVRPLWDKIVDIIPHYQQQYGIDGVMIDMGHALPPALKQRLVARAREVNPDFALWAEDFDLKPNSRAEGYTVCLGPFMQGVRDHEWLAGWLAVLHETGIPVSFMATPENHNTPRAVTWPGGHDYVLYAMTLAAFLPGVPYIHGGLELAETRPLNTGFDFTHEQQKQFPPEALHLFSAGAIDWTREENLVAELRSILGLRARYGELVSDPSGATLEPLKSGNDSVIAFARGLGAGERVLVVANGDMAAPQHAEVALPAPQQEIVDLLSGDRFTNAGSLFHVLLPPARVLVCELRDGTHSSKRQQNGTGSRSPKRD